jgi:hypothetical protein
VNIKLDSSTAAVMTSKNNPPLSQNDKEPVGAQ